MIKSRNKTNLKVLCWQRRLMGRESLAKKLLASHKANSEDNFLKDVVELSDAYYAHKHSFHNAKEILASVKIGCFYCLAISSASSVNEWCDNSWTGLCPQCGIDSIIGDISGFPITKEFMKNMQKFWFSIKKPPNME